MSNQTSIMLSLCGCFYYSYFINSICGLWYKYFIFDQMFDKLCIYGDWIFFFQVCDREQKVETNNEKNPLKQTIILSLLEGLSKSRSGERLISGRT